MPKVSKKKQNAVEKAARMNEKIKRKNNDTNFQICKQVDENYGPESIQQRRRDFTSVTTNESVINLARKDISTDNDQNYDHHGIEHLPSKQRDLIHDASNQSVITHKKKLLENTNVDSSSDEELIIEKEMEQERRETQIGRRIVNFSFICKQLLNLCNHGPLGCTSNDIILVGEKQNGLISKFTFKCLMCNVKFIVNSDNCDENYLNVNACAVAGTIATGCGYSQLEEFLSAMNLPTFSEKLYQNNHLIIGKHWEKVALDNMIEAGKKEKEIAQMEGRVTADGHGIIDVILDGCWSKRSYKKNYSASSGAAAIVGKNTGEILFLGVKNKYCQVCAIAAKENTEVKEHVCYKNYEGSSTAMESNILVEGFKRSVDQHGLVYGRLISDGDSSTYAKILESRPYKNVTVEKIECKNHILRNFCNKLQALSTETKYPLKDRKFVTKKTIMAMRGTITKSIKHHKTGSDVELLFNDIMRCHHHAFGDHSRCRQYFCNQVGAVIEERHINDFYTSALWQRICFLVQGIAGHARSLIHDVDSNKVESFHNIVAKFVGGKRVNFSKKNSYQIRVNAASVSFNVKKSISRLYKSVNGGNSPMGKLKKLEETRLRKNLKKRLTKKTRRRIFPASNNDKNYGESCLKPDLDSNTFEKIKASILNNLKKTDEELDKIQKKTILQSQCGEWMELRRSLLTASNFGKICKRREDTSCASTVKELLYKSDISNVRAIKHGRDNENKALLQLSSQMNLTIEKCGLFIDKQFAFLGATPDGLYGSDTVIEIKCPLVAHTIGIEEAIKNNKITFWKNSEINKNHNWYYQVQGQLRVTQRLKCIFGVWANENENMKVEVIKKDDEFWHTKMEKKLCKFYMNCILPELVDPRHPRNMPIRDPVYIEEAIKKKKIKNSYKM